MLIFLIALQQTGEVDIIISIGITVDGVLGVGTNVDRLIPRRCHSVFWEVTVTYRSYLSGSLAFLQCTAIESLHTYFDERLVFNVILTVVACALLTVHQIV